MEKDPATKAEAEALQTEIIARFQGDTVAALADLCYTVICIDKQNDHLSHEVARASFGFRRAGNAYHRQPVIKPAVPPLDIDQEQTPR